MALGADQIDPASFTSIRLLSGALTLWGLVAIRRRRERVDHEKPGWQGSLMLFAYAACFSLAYVSLDTATGALILFGAVQITMIGVSIIKGARPGGVEWLGLVLAFSGLVYLLLPGASAPSLLGFALMALSGIAWAFYTLGGKGSNKPLFDTALHFKRAVPMGLVMLLLAYGQWDLTLVGVGLAVLSGAFASGIGYAIWYAALRGLTTSRAAVLQLLVPVIAALGGVLFMQEAITVRFMVASLLV
ncbi:unnamed protein product, partial [Cyprideis torosa]